MPKRCTKCGGTDLTRKPAPNYRYVESGLSNVVIANGISIDTCGECGETFARIPAIVRMHRALALALTRKAGRPTGEEIRFLRKSIGLSGKDFAQVIGVAPETVSRWENDRDAMGSTADRMLRLLVRTYDLERDPDYSYADAADAEPDAADLVLSRGGGGWQQAPAPA